MLDRLRAALERRLAKLTAGPQVESVHCSNTQEVQDWRTLGNKNLADGNLEEAENCFRTAQSLNANDSDTLTCLGYTLKEMGRYVEARILLRRVVSLIGNLPEAHEAHYLIGQIAEQEGDLENAKIQYLEVLRLVPGFSLACSDLVRLYLLLRQDHEVPKLLALCVAASPGNADYRQWYGKWLLESEEYDRCIQEFDELVHLGSARAEDYCNRGIALQSVNRIDEALDSYNTAIALNPSLAQTYSNRGSIFKLRNQFDAAISDYREAMRLWPDSAFPYSNLGEVLRDTRQIEAAIRNYDKAIELEPQDPVAYWNKSLALLLSGRLIEGFELYERRWDNTMRDSKREFAEPLWLGDAPLYGKTILLHCEQGLGDTIQFCRYAPLVAALGGRVVLEVQPPLLGLLRDLSGVAQIVVRGDPLPDFDFHCPLLSSPLALKTDENNIPQDQAYLTASVVQSAKWSQKLGKKTKPRVGLVWSGSATHKNNHNRSIALSTFIENLSDNCDYFSLQNEVQPADLDVLKNTSWIRHFGAELADFTDTAALCKLMDVVVCVDTSVAHLSSALGCPTWILLPYSVDWRWMLDRSDSPWYPSAKLYRQEKIGCWDDVFLRVRADLTLLSSGL